MRASAGILLVVLAAPCGGQEFGQNQVVLRDFQWKVRSTEHFDVHYYEDSKPVVEDAARYLEEAFREVSEALDIQFEPPPGAPASARKRFEWKKRPFFLYASPNDFQQSSIVAAGDGTGGVTEPFKDRFMVYHDGSKQWLKEVIAHEFVHVLQFHILVNGFWRTGKILRTIILPLWVIEGMAGHYTRHIESALEETVIRDAATSGGLLPLTRLERFGHLKPHQTTLAYKQGAAALDFLSSQYGSRKVGEVLRLFDSHLDTSRVLEEAVGLDATAFDRKYREYLETKYRRQVRISRLQEPSAYGPALTKARDKLPQFNASPVFTPDLKTMYFVTTSAGYPPQVKEMELRSGKVSTISRAYTRVETLSMGHFANLSRILALSADGRTLAFIGTKNHRDRLFLFDRRTRRLESRDLPGFMTATQPQFSPDGGTVAFSGMKDAVVDIYLLDLASGTIERLTDDPADDEMPAFSPDGRWLVYSSETSDPLGDRGPTRRLYRLDLSDRSVERLENSGGEARDPIVSPDGRRVLFVLENDGFSELAELEVAAKSVTRLTRTVGSFTPAYAGEALAFASLRRGSVHIHKGPRGNFLSEPVAPEPWAPSAPLKMLLPGMGGVAPSTGTVALSPERPYEFSYSTDLFIPAFFYSSIGGLFMTAYWQGSDMLGIHSNMALANFQSGQSFDYTTRYAYSRWRTRVLAGADGSARKGLVESNTRHDINDSYHTQFAAASYPLDRYTRAEAFVRSASERVKDTTTNTSDDRQGRMHGYALVHDTVRGRYLVANAGHRLRLSIGQAAEVAGGSRRFHAAALEAHQFLPLGWASTLAFRAAAQESLGRDHPQLILGGLGGVRGFGRSETADAGSRLAVGTAEWRFPVAKDLDWYWWWMFPDFYFKAVFGTLFADAGTAWDSQGQLNATRWKDVRHSVGAGLRIYTFILQEFPLLISMDYAQRTNQNGGIFYVYLGQLF